MKIRNHFTVKLKDIPVYLILIPFLYPRGFSEHFSWYKQFFTLWLYAAMGVTFLLFLQRVTWKRVRYKKCTIPMLVFFLLMVSITLVVRGGLGEGLQKMFAAPALCLLCMMLLKKDPDMFLRCLSNILIVNFLLNLTLFSPLLWKPYFDVDEHLTFLGHVQVSSQLGILGLLLSYLLRSGGKKSKARLLWLLSLATMVMSETVASAIALVLILGGTALWRIGFRFKRFGKWAWALVAVWLVCSVGLLALTVRLNGKYYMFGVNVSMSGRMFIWQAALDLMESHWLLGHGVHGALIHVFWSKTGMNYAHSQLMQCLLDGGVILAAAFTVMLASYTRGIRRTCDKRLAYCANLCLGAFLAIMLIESVTEYHYFYLFLSLLAYLPDMACRIRDQAGGNNENC